MAWLLASVHLGYYFLFAGDIFDEEEILDWLTDPNVMDVVDHVEMINLDMFEKFKQRHEHIIALLGKKKAMKLISQHVH